MKSGNVLAIESAIGGGSVAVLSNGLLLDKWHSTDTVPRSEQLLQIISNLIDRSIGGKHAISTIAVSRGPGSYTGIRIGLATAMGLGAALNIPVIGVSVLRAIGFENIEVNRLVVVPIGRIGFCWQYFAAGASNADAAIESGSIDNLIQQYGDLQDLAVFAQSDAYTLLHEHGDPALRGVELRNCGSDVAVAVGIAASAIDEGLEPLYARDTLNSHKVAV